MSFKEFKMMVIFFMLESAPTILACSIFGLAVILFILGLADMACTPPAVATN